MYKTLSYETKLVSIASRRRRRDVVRLFEQFGGSRECYNRWDTEGEYSQGKYSIAHISNVLAGRRINLEITNAAYRLSYRRIKNGDLVN